MRSSRRSWMRVVGAADRPREAPGVVARLAGTGTQYGNQSRGEDAIPAETVRNPQVTDLSGRPARAVTSVARGAGSCASQAERSGVQFRDRTRRRPAGFGAADYGVSRVQSGESTNRHARRGFEPRSSPRSAKATKLIRVRRPPTVRLSKGRRGSWWHDRSRKGSTRRRFFTIQRMLPAALNSVAPIRFLAPVIAMEVRRHLDDESAAGAPAPHSLSPR